MAEYITIIKDIGSIIFTGVATVLGILTYRRAKATVLQPVRTEVVKKQSAKLSELLSLISQDEIVAFDYRQIVFVNVYSVLIDYGFVFSDQEELRDAMKKCAVTPCGEDNILREFMLFQPFDSEQDREKNKNGIAELKKKKYEKAKQEGVIIIDSIRTTNEHMTFVKRINGFVTDPFLPSGIQESLKDLTHTVNVNLTVHLKETLEEFTKEFFKKYSSEITPEFSVHGVFNEFNHKRFHHREQFAEIRRAIRDHLRIDERW